MGRYSKRGRLSDIARMLGMMKDGLDTTVQVMFIVEKGTRGE